MKLILAGNYRQFLQYCEFQRLRPDKDARYISDYTKIVGIHGGELTKIGTYYLRHDCEIILRHARSNNMIEITDYIF